MGRVPKTITMRYVYFLLINLCTSDFVPSEKVPETDSVTDLSRDGRFYVQPIPYTMDNILEFILSHMDNRWRPFDDIAPLNVSMNFLISSFDPLEEISMDVGLNFTMRQRWMDPRLMF